MNNNQINNDNKQIPLRKISNELNPSQSKKNYKIKISKNNKITFTPT